MTLTLELSRETEAWLQTEAAQLGIEPGEYARRLIESKRGTQPALIVESEDKRLVATDNAMGAFAHTPGGSDDFARRKQEEIELEETKFALRSAAPN